jgi:hypothetical protein
LHSSLFIPLLVAGLVFLSRLNKNLPVQRGSLESEFLGQNLNPCKPKFWSHIDPTTTLNYMATTTLPYYSTTTTAAANNNKNMTTTKTTTSPPLTLEQIINFDPLGEDNKRRFRYTNRNNEHQELYLSPCTGCNLAKVLLYAHNALELFEPIDFDTGEARFTLFRMALSGAASVAWRKVYADIPDGADLDWGRFCLTVTQWVDKFSMEEDRTELLAYLRSKLHKPGSLDCQQVLYALSMVNEMAISFLE